MNIDVLEYFPKTAEKI